MSERDAVYTDKDRMDWLVKQYVVVRTQCRYGSRESISASPDLEETESDLRTKIDAAMPYATGPQS